MRGRLIRDLLTAAAAAWLAVPAGGAAAERQTVCTITVNSADEKESFRRWLPASKFRFVELVETGRPDWLASACRVGVSCDMLVISGHYDGTSEFFSDRLEVREYLPVAELERASCSDTCPGLFSRLKEVYLFGCNTLNPEPQGGTAAEVVRSLVREQTSRKPVPRGLRVGVPGESGRDRMRVIFQGTPAIYGFDSMAPLGPIAATALDRWLRGGGAREAGQGRASRGLLAQFSGFGLSMTSGVKPADALFAVRRDMCSLADDRMTAARKLDFVRELLQRDLALSWAQLDRVQQFGSTLTDDMRGLPEVSQAFDAIAGDTRTRTRWLTHAREARASSERLRMLRLARTFGWLDDQQFHDELVAMLIALQAEPRLGLDELQLACTLNEDHELDGTFSRRVAEGSAADTVAHAAVRACLGSSEARARTLAALLGGSAADAQFAQAYLRLRPIGDDDELRRLAEDIGRMPASDAQVRALESLGRHYLRDRQVLDGLTRLFMQTRSAAVQVAVAGILIRADHRAIGSAALARSLREHRLASTGGENLIDALIRKLQSP